MDKKDKEGDRVWNGLKLSDDHLSEEEIKAYLETHAEENPNGNSKDN